jgi:hypothetical protein
MEQILRSAGGLFASVLVPILILVTLGWALRRRFELDLDTLSKLQIYLFVPAFNFMRISESDLAWSEMGSIVVAMLLAALALAVPLWFICQKRGINRPSTASLVLASIVFNSGNFGIPLAERAFGDAGGAVQALILMTANLTIWVLGYLLLSGATQGFSGAMLGFLKTPMPWSLGAGLLFKGTHWTIPESISYPLELLAAGLVPAALIMLGAQLAIQRRTKPSKRVILAVSLKMLVLPSIMTVIVFMMGLWPWPGAMLILASAAPSAVNSFLLAVELKGDAELAAECVFWSTIVSAVTVTLIMTAVIEAGGRPPRINNVSNAASPSVIFRRGFVAREDGVDLRQRFCRELNFKRAQRARQLVHITWPNDRCCHRGLVNQPG